MEGVEVLYFGCYRVPGHCLYSKVTPNMRYEATPWGNSLDSGLLTDDYYGADTEPTGKVVVRHKDGWTAIAFWDRSGDSRPGSNTAFLAKADMTGEELLALARVQWPEVFDRRPGGWPPLKIDELEPSKASGPA
jgi:hypothetical protein